MKILTCALVSIFLHSATAMAQSHSLPDGWAISAGGAGGLSTAVANLSPTEGIGFGFIDTTGATDISMTGIDNATTGTVALSKLFTLASSRSVSVDLNFLSNDGEEFSDFAVVQLLDGRTSAVIATLYTANTTCAVCRAVPAIGGPGSISDGVTLSSNEAYFDGRFSGLLGGIPYGPTRWFDGNGGSTGWVTASYDLEPGTYQLAFIVGNVYDAGLESALAFDNIHTQGVLIDGLEIAQVPEPGQYIALIGGMAVLLIARKRGDRPHSRK